MLFVRRLNLAHATANGAHDSGEPLEGGIGFEKKIVLPTAVAVELDFNDAESLIERLEDGPVSDLAAAGSGSCR